MARRTIVTKDNTITSQGTEPLSREVARPIFGENVLAIDYNFADKKILDDDIDFSRASGATQTNSEGKICYAPENLVTYTDDFSNSQDRFTYRSGHSISHTANQTDPNGGTDAALFANVTGSSANDFWKQVTGIGASAPYIPSFFIKRVSTTGTIKLANPSGGSSSWLINMAALPDDWVRITPSHSAVTVETPFTAHTNGSGGLWFRSNDGSALSFYLAFPQVERTFDNSSEPSDFIENKSGSAVHKERFDYDKDGNSKGLLVEEGRTNLFTYSQDFSTSWIKTNVNTPTISSNLIDPSGGYASYKLTENTANSFHFTYLSVTMGAVAHTLSCYMKAGERSTGSLMLTQSGNVGALFNLETGQVDSVTGTGNTAQMVDVGNGWYRCSITNDGSADIGNFARIGVQNGAYNSYQGDGVSGIYIFGAQLEQGSFPTSLIPTYGATASRSSDIASVSGTAFSRFFKDTEGTIVVDVQMPKGWKDTNYNRFYSFNDASHQNRITAWLDVGSQQEPRGQIVSGNTNQGSVVAKSIPLNTGEITRVGQSYATDRHYTTADSSAGNFDGTVTLPTGIKKLNIGSGYGGVSPLGGWIRRLRYFNKRKINAQVQKLTDTSFLLDKFKGAKAAHSLRSLRDGRDNSAVTRIRREYDSFEADYTANQVANGDLEKDFRSADQTTLPLDVSCEATELVVNGAFDSSTSWVATAPWSIANGVATWDDSAIGVLHTSTGSTFLKKGRTYTVSFDVVSGASPQIWIGNAQGSYSYDGRSYAVRNIGHHSETFTIASDQNTLGFYGNTNGTAFSIDNVSLKEVNPIASGFSTRKINSSYTGKAMRCRNQGNVEVEVGFDDNNEISLDSPVTNTSQNLVSYSEDFSQSVWTKVNTTVSFANITDPFGGTNAYIVKPNTVNSQHRLDLPTSVGTGAHTFSVFAKAEAYNAIWMRRGGSSTTFDLTNGTVHADSGYNNPTITAVGTDGWYRLSITKTGSANDTFRINVTTTAISGGDYTGNGTDGIYLFGAQLEETVYDDGVEKITNGTFDTDSDWSSSSGVSISNGKLNFTITNGGNQFARQSGINYQVGKKYRLTAKIKRTSLTAGGHPGGVEFQDDANGNGDLNHVVTLDGTEQSVSVEFTQTKFNKDFLFIRYDAGTTFTFEVDDVSLLEISPELQTYAQTPVISDDGSNTTATTLGEFAGKENLIPYSEDFSQWTNQGGGNVNLTSGLADPFGGNNAFSIQSTTASFFNNIFQHIAAAIEPNTTHTYSFFIKKETSKTNFGAVAINLTGGTTKIGYLIIDEVNGTAVNIPESTINTPTIDVTEPITGWYRFAITVEDTHSNTNAFMVLYSGFSSNGTTASAVTGSPRIITGVQINSNTLKPYQKTSGTPFTGDVHVVNWYDQNGGEDFVNATAGEQPRVVMGSELVTDSGGKASVFFDGGDTLDNNTLTGHNRLDSYSIQETSDTTYVFLADPNSSNRYGIAVENGQSLPFLASEFGTPSYYVNGALQSFANRDDAHDVLTGKTNLLSQHNASTKTWTGLIVGQYFNGTTSPSYNYTGKISEMVFFPNMDSSPKRFPIEQNMMNHFDVNLYYEDFNDGTGGWVDTESGGSNTTLSHETTNPLSGSGSLKIALSNTGSSGGYPRVRKNTGTAFRTGIKYRLSFKAKALSGTGECDIRFGTASTNMYWVTNQTFTTTEQTYTYTDTFDTLPTAGTDAIQFIFDGTKGPFELLLDDVKVEELGVEGYVTTLYDQTGNNCHALQATASYQPQIVSGGDLIKSGNHPAWEHLSLSNMELFGKLKAAHLDAWFVADTSDTHYLYPGNFAASNDFGWVAQDGTTSNAGQVSDYGGGDSKLYANGTLVGAAGSITRDAVHTALNGRKLVHHQDADTADWDKVQMGFYYNASTDTIFIFQGKFSEWIWYDSDQSSNKTGIESNINTHYNIY